MTDTLRLITDQNRTGIEQINKTLEEKINFLTGKIEEINKTNRDAITSNLKDFSLEQSRKVVDLKEQQKEQYKAAAEQLDKITNKVEDKLNKAEDQMRKSGDSLLDKLDKAFKGFNEIFKEKVEEMKRQQQEKFGILEDKQQQLIANTEKKLE